MLLYNRTTYLALAAIFRFISSDSLCLECNSQGLTCGTHYTWKKSNNLNFMVVIYCNCTLKLCVQCFLTR